MQRARMFKVASICEATRAGIRQAVVENITLKRRDGHSE
jgi:hypothetical protein